jgi:hypothetical protein
MGRACSTHGEKRNAYRILVGKPERHRPLGRRRWVYNIKMDLGEIGCGVMDWLDLVQDSLTLSLMLRPTVSRPICLGMKHPFGAYDQIFITVRQLWVCFYGVLSLTRGRVCRL